MLRSELVDLKKKFHKDLHATSESIYRPSITFKKCLRRQNFLKINFVGAVLYIKEVQYPASNITNVVYPHL